MDTQTQTGTAGNGHDATAAQTTTRGPGDTTAIVKIDRLLGALTDEERSRVVRFVAEKYESYLND